MRQLLGPCPSCDGSGEQETGIGVYPCDACHGARIVLPTKEEAQLIDAAPDMLAAGQAVLDAWERGDLTAAVCELSAAIAKARGA